MQSYLCLEYFIVNCLLRNMISIPVKFKIPLGMASLTYMALLNFDMHSCGPKLKHQKLKCIGIERETCIPIICPCNTNLENDDRKGRGTKIILTSLLAFPTLAINIINDLKLNVVESYLIMLSSVMPK